MAFISPEPIAFSMAAVKSLPPAALRDLAVAAAETLMASKPLIVGPTAIFISLAKPRMFSSPSLPIAFKALLADSSRLVPTLPASSLNLVIKLKPSFSINLPLSANSFCFSFSVVF